MQAFVFCPLQPAIVLAPINCTQTAAPPTKEASAKPESPTAEDQASQSEDSPQDPPQKTPPVESNEEGKNPNWNNV